MTTEQQLAEIRAYIEAKRAIVNAAKPGPWEAWRGDSPDVDGYWRRGISDGRGSLFCVDDGSGTDALAHDLTFAADSRNHRLRELDALERQVNLLANEVEGGFDGLGKQFIAVMYAALIAP